MADNVRTHAWIATSGHRGQKQGEKKKIKSIHSGKHAIDSHRFAFKHLGLWMYSNFDTLPRSAFDEHFNTLSIRIGDTHLLICKTGVYAGKND